ncbi:MAG: hypothetical protein H3C47_05695 [Candidatus Cloacimonetes bacterium]|nr:hypothetical protein [Candidatus Cloacimonadota bacterium]
MEREQFQIVQQILALGHSVGIHLDLAFYNPITTTELCDAIELEISFFKNHLGVEPEVFSFHNPTQFALTTFVEDTYCNLVNCYSQTFWQKVAYCSDSNGYWRFKRLLDFLKNNTASHLQVLTHPGMWQDTPLAPMERILRCIHGRSANVLDIYYETLQSSGRMNLGGPLEDFEFLKALDPQLHMTLQLLLLHKKYSQLAVIFLNLHFEWLVEFTSIPTSQTENIQNISKQFYNQYNVSWLDICQTNLAEYNTNAGKTHNTHETHIYRYFLHISKLLFIWHSESYNAKNV